MVTFIGIIFLATITSLALVGVMAWCYHTSIVLLKETIDE